MATKQQPYPWLKLYTKLLNDRDWLRCSEGAQLLYVKLLLLKQAHKYDGASTEDLAFEMRMDEGVIEARIQELIDANLLSKTRKIRNFEKYQENAHSRERVRRHRENKAKELEECNVTVALQQRHRNALEEEVDVEVDTEVEEEASAARAESAAGHSAVFILTTAGPLPIPSEQIKMWQNQRPDLDILAVIRKAQDRWQRNDKLPPAQYAIERLGNWIARERGNGDNGPPKPKRERKPDTRRRFAPDGTRLPNDGVEEPKPVRKIDTRRLAPDGSRLPNDGRDPS